MSEGGRKGGGRVEGRKGGWKLGGCTQNKSKKSNKGKDEAGSGMGSLSLTASTALSTALLREVDLPPPRDMLEGKGERVERKGGREGER